MVKDETSVTPNAINPIFSEFFEALMLLQILRYFMGMQKDIQGIYKKIRNKSKQYFLYFQWFEGAEYSKIFNCNDMLFASLHKLK